MTAQSGSTERLSEEEIRPKKLMTEQQRRFANDVARLLRRAKEFVHVPCPACGSIESAPQWTKYELSYVGCAGCGTIYINPRPPPEVLEEYYRKSENYAYWNEVIFPASEDARREKLFAPRAQRLVEICKRHGVVGGSVLEVGSGFGTFGQELKRLGYFTRFTAVEPTPDLAATCRKRGHEVIEAPIEQVNLSDASVDLVCSFEVIEHLFSPRSFLEKCAKLLKPGGMLVLSCPSAAGFDIQTLREKSSAVDVEHLNYFTPASLSRLLKSHGFETLEVLTPGKLDAELVRTQVLAGEVSLEGQPFLKTVLVDRWDEVGGPFQDFLAQNRLSSHLWIVAKRH